MTSLIYRLILLEPCLVFWTCIDSAIKKYCWSRKKYTHMETYTSRTATLHVHRRKLCIIDRWWKDFSLVFFIYVQDRSFCKLLWELSVFWSKTSLMCSLIRLVLSCFFFVVVVPNLYNQIQHCKKHITQKSMYIDKCIRSYGWTFHSKRQYSCICNGYTLKKVYRIVALFL